MEQIRILIAEDNCDHQCLLLRNVVKGRPGTSVTIASTRAELIEACGSSTFDCIVLDYNLTPFTAPVLINDIEPLQPDVPMIVISSSNDQRVVIEAIRHGVVDFVPKCHALDGDTLRLRIDAAISEARHQNRERRRLNRRLRSLEHRAKRDPLTGLFNRREAELYLQRRGRGSDRRESTAVFFIDLDHFKRINDTLGHDAGDGVLRTAADVLKDLTESSDIVARWGGEEFLVLRQSDSLPQAWAWANNVRQSLSETISLPQEMGKQTASIGIDVVPTDELSPSIISRADHAMYLAKDSGRDRVCTWQMLQIIDAAHEIATENAAGPRDIALSLLRCIHGDLGPVQLEHSGPHGERVQQLADRIGRALGVSGEQLQTLALAAQFHDIGKVAIPESLLALPRSLTPAEQQVVDQHSQFGSDLLTACLAPEHVSNIVAHHHERFDRREPLDACEAPTPASIISCCDAAITMLSDRPYASAQTPSQMLSEMRNERGKQFDPQVVDALHCIEQSEWLAAA